MLRLVLVLLLVAVVVLALVELAQADPDRVRAMPRWLWAAAIVLLPGFGAVAWFVAGRPRGPRAPSGRRPIAPDDDPDFLGRL